MEKATERRRGKAEARPQHESPSPELRELWAYIAAHPVTVDLETGKPVKWKTRLELRQKLRRKRFSPEVIEKLVSVYMTAIVGDIAQQAPGRAT